MKLLADAMLGRLARWLRILGYDTVYSADTDDFAVLRLARAGERLILTRDHDLAERRGVRTLLITSESLEDQLREVRAAIGPPTDTSFSRCPECNGMLVEAPPALVTERVPPFVRRTQRHFSLCEGCGRVYWRGTHWERMQELITGLRAGEGSDTIEA